MQGVTGVSGLVSGLPTGDLIDAMIAADRAATVKLEERKAVFEARLEGIRGLNSRLLSAQIDLSALKRPATFAARTATTSSTSLSVSAGASAVPGTYTLQNVVAATSHQIATAGQANDASSLGTGTVTLRLGNGVEKTLDLSGGASLQDLATAISGSGTGISAYVANAGSGATPYRLILQGGQTGSANTISISGTDAFDPLFDAGNLTTLQTAGNASFELGSGGTPLPFSSASNTVSGAIAGVTFTIGGNAASASITVGTDAGVARDAITTFAESLNGAISYLRSNSGYDPETREAGLLLSETDLRRGIDSTVRQLFALTNPSGSVKTVTGLGMSLDRESGEVVIDDSVLDAALANDPAGVAALFANSGSATAGGIALGSLSKATDTSSSFAVNITTAAARAKVGAGSDLAASTVINPGNSQLSLTINGTAYAVGLVAGTYTRQALADHIQTVLDQTVATGHRTSVLLEGDRIALRSQRYGAAQTIQVDAGSTANAALFLNTSQQTGTDVAGTINGIAATGTGQILSGAADTAAEGLQLLVTAESPFSTAFTARKGLGQLLGESLEGLTDIDTGTITQKEEAFQTIVADMTGQIDKVDQRLEARRLRFQSMFASLETVLSQFQTQENFLRGQLDAFSNMASARAGR